MMACKLRGLDTLIDLKFFLREYFFVKRFQPSPQLLSTMMNEQDLFDVAVRSLLIWFLNLLVISWSIQVIKGLLLGELTRDEVIFHSETFLLKFIGLESGKTFYRPSKAQ